MKKVVKYLVVEKLEGKEQYYLRFTPEMQDDIGTIGFIQYKNTDKKVLHKDDIFLNLEASKAILTLKMPFDASVVEINKDAMANPKLLSSPNENENWVMILSNIDPKTLEQLEDF